MKILKKLRKTNNLTRQALAKYINIDDRTIEHYESNRRNPWSKSLITISNFFKFSIDYIINDGKTNYSKNLKFLRLAKIFDKQEMRDQRNQIEANAVSFLSKVKNKDFQLKIDIFNNNLTNNFHDNLKKIRLSKKITQEKLAKLLGFSIRQISGYENEFYPPINKLKNLSKILEISAHCLLTGEKLFFKFDDKHFGDTMIKADHFLPLEEHKMLIHLMETILSTP